LRPRALNTEAMYFAASLSSALPLSLEPISTASLSM
jgi:hypothetical protein